MADLLSLFLLFSIFIQFSLTQNEDCSSKITQTKPVIGIYGNSEPENDDIYVNGTYYPIFYIHWLEQYNVDVIAIHYWYSDETLINLMSKINGILFLGGNRAIIEEGIWEKKTQLIFERALQTQLPIWGTCQGLQLMGALLSGNISLLKYGFEDYGYLHNLSLTNETKNSIMYKYFREKDYDALQNKNATIYLHNLGFFPEEFFNNSRLSELFKVTSIAENSKGVKFINSFEGKNDSIKFYAVQFHPERNPFRRSNNHTLPHEMQSLRVNFLFGLAFVDVARNNSNRFPIEERKKYDFFDNYRGTPNSKYDQEIERLYFSKDHFK